MTLSVEDDTATTASQQAGPGCQINSGNGDFAPQNTSDNGAAFLTKQRSMLIPLVSLDLNKGLEAISEKAVHSLPPRSPKCGTNLGKAVLARGPSETDDQNNAMNGFMTVTSVSSVSKGDIELLENKISVLEKQISKIKK